MTDVVRLDDVRDIPDMSIPAEPDSWEPIKLSDLPDEPPSQPTLGGLGIAYPGTRHIFSGPPESAKTIAAYILGLEVIRAGGTVIVIDFEMGRYQARNRLRDMGATDDELHRVIYVEPHEAATEERIDRLVRLKPDLVIIDAAAGAYSLQGLDDNKRLEVEAFAKLYVERFWRAGAATVLVDHVVKNAEGRGRFAIGSERKLGGSDVHLGFDIIAPISRGTSGTYKVTTHKDRHGYLQRGRLVDLILTSDPATHQITWQLTQAEHANPGDYFRPSELMSRVTQWLERNQHDEPHSLSSIKEAVKGDNSALVKAVEALCIEGYASEQKGPRDAREIRHIKLWEGQPRPTSITPLNPSATPPKRGTDDPSTPYTVEGSEERGQNDDPSEYEYDSDIPF